MQGRVAFLPFIRISLKSLRREDFDFKPTTIGEHILRQRRSLQISQSEAANRMRVNAWTVLNWEKGHTEPPTTSCKVIVGFLGYDPYPVPQTLPERMLAVRRRQGWTIGAAAFGLGVDPSSWTMWERTGRVPWARYRDRLETFLRKFLNPVR